MLANIYLFFPQGLLTLFCFAIVVLPCSNNLPCTIICWVWFNMYWKHLYVGKKRKLLYMWKSHPLRLWTLEETSTELKTSAEKAPWWLWVLTDEAAFKLCSPSAPVMTSVLNGKIEQCTLWCHGEGKSVEPMRSCSHTCKCIWALNVTDYQ